MFTMQQRLFDQQRRFVERSFEMQRRMLDSVDAGLEAQHSAEKQSRHLAQMAFDATIDAWEQSIPGEEPAMDDIREMIDEQFEAGDKLSEEAWTALESTIEDSVDTYGDMLDQSEEFYSDMFDAYMQTAERVEEQVEEAS